MVRFILNDKEINSTLPPGSVLLDLIRYDQRLTGTKIGCREGDCGACTVLIGELKNGELKYEPMTSCLVPLGNVHGKHVVTVEGINNKDSLNPIQQAMSDAGATQCGFCTPGFVMSLAGFCLSNKKATSENAIAAIDGNICRCTGYKSIERAAEKVMTLMQERKSEAPEKFVAAKKILPAYFAGIKEKLSALQKSDGLLSTDAGSGNIVGGGTDLYVQKHDEMTHASIRFVFDQEELNGIWEEENKCIIGPSVTVTDLNNSSLIQKHFPAFDRYAKLVSSTPIRNMATIAGNFINASPIGDFTIFFLALDAQIALSNGKQKRELPLKNFYTGYKSLDKKPNEFIEQISFELPNKNFLFNFEKVSKRTHLDIASVNTAIHLKMNGKRIDHASLSAGGVGPVPMCLQKTSDFLKGKEISESLAFDAIEVMQTEIAPISDARGTKEYKTFLLGQLIKAHFMVLFPELDVVELLK